MANLAILSYSNSSMNFFFFFFFTYMYLVYVGTGWSTLLDHVLWFSLHAREPSVVGVQGLRD